jgi:hypothetical protein
MSYVTESEAPLTHIDICVLKEQGEPRKAET